MKKQLTEKEIKLDVVSGEGVVYQGKIYAPFVKARDFVHTLKLQDIDQWYQYCRNELAAGKPPETIPIFPDEVYRGYGWAGWNDWLYNSRKGKKQFRSFKKARRFIKSLQLKSNKEWRAYCKGHFPEKGKRPPDIPTNPNRAYKKEWKSWGDWLGTGKIALYQKEFLPFSEARDFARSLNLKFQNEWKAYCRGEYPEKGKRHQNIPYAPEKTYKKKWKGYGDWLGTGNIAPFNINFLPFKQARAFARKLNLNNVKEWQLWSKGGLSEKGKRPKHIPANPERVYKKEWKTWGDWLGNGVISSHKRNFLPFRKARAFARKLDLSKQTEWLDFCRGGFFSKGILPDDIPKAPHRVYKEWTSWGDWLGTGTISSHKRKFRSFEEAREFVQKLKLKSATEWRKYYRGEFLEKGKFPEDIPINPDRVYKKNWRGMGDWLGTGRIASRNRRFRSFKSARCFVRKLSLKSQLEWKAFCKKELPEKGELPIDIPTNPNRTYADQWVSLDDWLGTS